MERAALADHLFRPRALPGAAARPDGLSDLFVGSVEEANRRRDQAAAQDLKPPMNTDEHGWGESVRDSKPPINADERRWDFTTQGPSPICVHRRLKFF